MRMPRPAVPPRPLATLCLALLLAPAAAAQATAAPGIPEHKVRAWAAACYSCHGPDGKSQFGMPPLQGKSAGEIAAALVSFRSGKREATIMHQHARGYSDAQLIAIAGHIAAGRK